MPHKQNLRRDETALARYSEGRFCDNNFVFGFCSQSQSNIDQSRKIWHLAAEDLIESLLTDSAFENIMKISLNTCAPPSSYLSQVFQTVAHSCLLRVTISYHNRASCARWPFFSSSFWHSNNNQTRIRYVITMHSWSNEAIIALITLLATCLQFAVYSWHIFKRRRCATCPASGNGKNDHKSEPCC